MPHVLVFSDHRANCIPQPHLFTVQAAKSCLYKDRTGASGIIGGAMARLERLPRYLRVCGGRRGVLRSRYGLDRPHRVAHFFDSDLPRSIPRFDGFLNLQRYSWYVASICKLQSFFEISSADFGYHRYFGIFLTGLVDQSGAHNSVGFPAILAVSRISGASQGKRRGVEGACACVPVVWKRREGDEGGLASTCDRDVQTEVEQEERQHTSADRQR